MGSLNCIQYISDCVNNLINNNERSAQALCVQDGNYAGVGTDNNNREFVGENKEKICGNCCKLFSVGVKYTTYSGGQEDIHK